MPLPWGWAQMGHRVDAGLLAVPTLCIPVPGAQQPPAERWPSRCPAGQLSTHPHVCSLLPGEGPASPARRVSPRQGGSDVPGHATAHRPPSRATSEGWSRQGSEVPSAAPKPGTGQCVWDSAGCCVPSIRLRLALLQQLLAWDLPAPCFQRVPPPTRGAPRGVSRPSELSTSGPGTRSHL